MWWRCPVQNHHQKQKHVLYYLYFQINILTQWNTLKSSKLLAYAWMTIKKLIFQQFSNFFAKIDLPFLQKRASKTKVLLPSQNNSKHCLLLLYYLNRNSGFHFQCISIFILQKHPPRGVQKNILNKHRTLLKVNSTTDTLIIICRNLSEQILLR